MANLGFPSRYYNRGGAGCLVLATEDMVDIKRGRWPGVESISQEEGHLEMWEENHRDSSCLDLKNCVSYSSHLFAPVSANGTYAEVVLLPSRVPDSGVI